jgi:Ca2+-binding EF-hand superfamily protein
MVLVIVLMSLVQGTSFGADKPVSPSEREFCKLDKNNDRELSFDEFAACEFYKLEHVRALPLLEMKDLKKDSNGNVSDEDLKAYLFKKADRNKNGKIDRKEWEEFYNSLVEPEGDISRGSMDRKY